jgi:hypothetical protein
MVILNDLFNELDFVIIGLVPIASAQIAHK